MFVYREVKTNPGNEFVRPIQQTHSTAAESFRAGIAGQDVNEVSREVDRATQTTTHDAGQAEVAKVAAGTRSALQLVEAREVVRFVPVKSIKWDQVNA